MIEETLTFGELVVGAQVGVIRRIRGMKRAQAYGATENDENLWERDIISSQAEMAVAKHFNLHWPGLTLKLDEPDVGGLIEVRSIDAMHKRLMLHPEPKDKPHLPFVLVYAKPPRFVLLGWIIGGDGKCQEYWADPTGKNRPAFFVPQSALHPIEQLKERIADHAQHERSVA